MATTDLRANSRFLLVPRARIATPGTAAIDNLHFRYILGTYNKIVNGEATTVTDTLANTILDNFFLEQAKSGIIANGDKITIVSGTAITAVETEKKVAITLDTDGVTVKTVALVAIT